MPNQHRPGYQRWFQSIRREALSRLAQQHRPEYDDLVAELKTRKPFTPTNQ